MSIIEKALEKAVGRDQPLAPTVVEPPGIPTCESPNGAKVSEFSESGFQPDGTKKFHRIHWIALKENGTLVPEMNNTRMAEEYRLINSALMVNAFPKKTNRTERPNLIQITSSLPGEGKTFTAVNLAFSLAMEREKTVLLVDADVTKPAIADLLGISAEAGLIDLLKDTSLHFADVVCKTDLPNLMVLPAGKQDFLSTEVLAGDAMKHLAGELSSRYPDRVVILDSPSLLVATQGLVLATLVGQIVMVVEADRTPQKLVRKAISKLESCAMISCAMISCVLNKSNKGSGLEYDDYDYGYYGQQKAPY